MAAPAGIPANLLATVQAVLIEKLGWLRITPAEQMSSKQVTRAKTLHVAWDTMQVWLAVCWEYGITLMRAQHCLRIAYGLPPPWTDADAKSRYVFDESRATAGAALPKDVIASTRGSLSLSSHTVSQQQAPTTSVVNQIVVKDSDGSSGGGTAAAGTPTLARTTSSSSSRDLARTASIGAKPPLSAVSSQTMVEAEPHVPPEVDTPLEQLTAAAKASMSSLSTHSSELRNTLIDGPPAPRPVDYKISVATADIAGAGTDAKVTVVLRGAHGVSEPLVLDSQGKDLFERGQVDDFDRQSKHVGRVEELVLVLENPKDKAPLPAGASWKPDSIEVYDPHTTLTYVFDCKEWLDFSSEGGGNKVERVLKPDRDLLDRQSVLNLIGAQAAGVELSAFSAKLQTCRALGSGGAAAGKLAEAASQALLALAHATEGLSKVRCLASSAAALAALAKELPAATAGLRQDVPAQQGAISAVEACAAETAEAAGILGTLSMVLTAAEAEAVGAANAVVADLAALKSVFNLGKYKPLLQAREQVLGAVSKLRTLSACLHKCNGLQLLGTTSRKSRKGQASEAGGGGGHSSGNLSVRSPEGLVLSLAEAATALAGALEDTGEGSETLSQVDVAALAMGVASKQLLGCAAFQRAGFPALRSSGQAAEALAQAMCKMALAFAAREAAESMTDLRKNVEGGTRAGEQRVGTRIRVVSQRLQSCVTLDLLSSGDAAAAAGAAGDRLIALSGYYERVKVITGLEASVETLNALADRLSTMPMGPPAQERIMELGTVAKELSEALEAMGNEVVKKGTAEDMVEDVGEAARLLTKELKTLTTLLASNTTGGAIGSVVSSLTQVTKCFSRCTKFELLKHKADGMIKTLSSAGASLADLEPAGVQAEPVHDLLGEDESRERRLKKLNHALLTKASQACASAAASIREASVMLRSADDQEATATKRLAASGTALQETAAALNTLCDRIVAAARKEAEEESAAKIAKLNEAANGLLRELGQLQKSLGAVTTTGASGTAEAMENMSSALQEFSSMRGLDAVVLSRDAAEALPVGMLESYRRTTADNPELVGMDASAQAKQLLAALATLNKSLRNGGSTAGATAVGLLLQSLGKCLVKCRSHGLMGENSHYTGGAATTAGGESLVNVGRLEDTAALSKALRSAALDVHSASVAVASAAKELSQGLGAPIAEDVATVHQELEETTTAMTSLANKQAAAETAGGAVDDTIALCASAVDAQQKLVAAMQGKGSIKAAGIVAGEGLLCVARCLNKYKARAVLADPPRIEAAALAASATARHLMHVTTSGHATGPLDVASISAMAEQLGAAEAELCLLAGGPKEDDTMAGPALRAVAAMADAIRATVTALGSHALKLTTMEALDLAADSTAAVMRAQNETATIRALKKAGNDLKPPSEKMAELARALSPQVAHLARPVNQVSEELARTAARMRRCADKLQAAVDRRMEQDKVLKQEVAAAIALSETIQAAAAAMGGMEKELTSSQSTGAAVAAAADRAAGAVDGVRARIDMMLAVRSDETAQGEARECVARAGAMCGRLRAALAAISPGGQDAASVKALNAAHAAAKTAAPVFEVSAEQGAAAFPGGLREDFTALSRVTMRVSHQLEEWACELDAALCCAASHDSLMQVVSDAAAATVSAHGAVEDMQCIARSMKRLCGCSTIAMGGSFAAISQAQQACEAAAKALATVPTPKDIDYTSSVEAASRALGAADAALDSAAHPFPAALRQAVRECCASIGDAAAALDALHSELLVGSASRFTATQLSALHKTLSAGTLDTKGSLVAATVQSLGKALRKLKTVRVVREEAAHVTAVGAAAEACVSAGESLGKLVRVERGVALGLVAESAVVDALRESAASSRTAVTSLRDAEGKLSATPVMSRCRGHMSGAAAALEAFAFSMDRHAGRLEQHVKLTEELKAAKLASRNSPAAAAATGRAGRSPSPTSRQRNKRDGSPQSGGDLSGYRPRSPAFNTRGEDFFMRDDATRRSPSPSARVGASTDSNYTIKDVLKLYDHQEFLSNDKNKQAGSGSSPRGRDDAGAAPPQQRSTAARGSPAAKPTPRSPELRGAAGSATRRVPAGTPPSPGGGTKAASPTKSAGGGHAASSHQPASPMAAATPSRRSNAVTPKSPTYPPAPLSPTGSTGGAAKQPFILTSSSPKAVRTGLKPTEAAYLRDGGVSPVQLEPHLIEYVPPQKPVVGLGKQLPPSRRGSAASGWRTATVGAPLQTQLQSLVDEARFWTNNRNAGIQREWSAAIKELEATVASGTRRSYRRPQEVEEYLRRAEGSHDGARSFASESVATSAIASKAIDAASSEMALKRHRVQVIRSIREQVKQRHGVSMRAPGFNGRGGSPGGPE